MILVNHYAIRPWIPKTVLIKRCRFKIMSFSFVLFDDHWYQFFWNSAAFVVSNFLLHYICPSIFYCHIASILGWMMNDQQINDGSTVIDSDQQYFSNELRMDQRLIAATVESESMVMVNQQFSKTLNCVQANDEWWTLCTFPHEFLLINETSRYRINISRPLYFEMSNSQEFCPQRPEGIVL